MRVAPLLADLFALFYPSLCFACDDVLVSGEHDCCTNCRTGLPYLNYHLPNPAAAPTETPLARRFWGKVPIQHAVAYLQFEPRGRVQQLLHRLKYENQPEIGRIIGRWFGEELRETGYQAVFDGLVAVPMHPNKQRRRGYNQAVCFAEGLSEVLETPIWADVLAKTSDTESQTRKDRLERWRNAGSGFALAPDAEETLAGRRVLLVDDVLTTGATLEACATALQLANVATVSIATIAAAG